MSSLPSAVTVENEVEVKYTLKTAVDYLRVVNMFTHGISNTPLLNMDRYYDSSAGCHLTQKGAYLRMRCSKNGCMLTLKETVADISGGVANRTETSLLLDANEAATMMTYPPAMLTSEQRRPEVVEFFNILVKKYQIEDLCQQGSMTNIRIKVPLQGFVGSFLEIDHVEFVGQTRLPSRLYEIEVETKEPEKMRQYLEFVLNFNQIDYQPSTMSKFEAVTGLKIEQKKQS